MTHRAEQIVQRCVTLIEAREAASVFAHRRESLSSAIDELPAISVDYGDDEPSEFRTLNDIGSDLTVQAMAVVSDTTEQAVRQALLDLRREIHIALMADRRLGLFFVVEIRYRGASAPEIEVDANKVFGSLTSNWLVRYRMQLEDPGN